MSYEGFEQLLCAKGHLREFDCYEPYLYTDLCSCGAPYVYRHSVNMTNGIVEDDPSTLRYAFEVDKEAQYITCNLGHKHCVVEETFKIPKGRD